MKLFRLIFFIVRPSISKNHKILFLNLRIHSWEFTYFHFLMNFMVSELSWTRGPISYFWSLVLSGRKKPTWLRGPYKYSWIHWFIESLKIHCSSQWLVSWFFGRTKFPARHHAGWNIRSNLGDRTADRKQFWVIQTSWDNRFHNQDTVEIIWRNYFQKNRCN